MNRGFVYTMQSMILYILLKRVADWGYLKKKKPFDFYCGWLRIVQQSSFGVNIYKKQLNNLKEIGPVEHHLGSATSFELILFFIQF